MKDTIYKELKDVIIRVAEHSMDVKRENLFLKISLNNNKNYVYVTNHETDEIIYINDVLEKRVGDVLGQKCYESFSGLLSQCEFCTNDKLKLNKPYTWVHYNTHFNQLFYIIDVLKEINGVVYRFEKATDITDQIQELKELIKIHNL